MTITGILLAIVALFVTLYLLIVGALAFMLLQCVFKGHRLDTDKCYHAPKRNTGACKTIDKGGVCS